MYTCSPDYEGLAGSGSVVWWQGSKDDEGTKQFYISCPKAADNEPDDEFALKVKSKVKNFRGDEKTIWTSGYTLYVDDEATPPPSIDEGVNWYNELAYLDGSYTVGLSGTAEINADITGAIILAEEFLYLYAADTGDTTITLTI
jgi:hypothetical protein